MMNQVDKRKHQRYIPSAKTFVYTADSFGRILDISAGGFSLQYIDVDSPIRKQENVDILLGSLSLMKVPVTVVWDSRSGVPRGRDASIMSKVGVKFVDLTSQQKDMIDFFISQQIAGNA
ncbi:MAG: PilZ domain-containing protein [Thermodesulfobacteriota bacterium]